MALASVEKLDQAKHEYVSICCAKNDALNAVQTMLVNVGTEVLRAKKEMSKYSRSGGHVINCISFCFVRH